MGSPAFNKIRIWDLPTRAVHWLLGVLFAFSWWTADTARLDWHKLSGYSILALVLFRLYWGVFGSDTARFQNFVTGPRAFFAHARTMLRPSAGAIIGHTPTGAWSVLAMLSLLLLQPVLGLFAVDIDGIESGPLSHLVSFDTGRKLAEWHNTIFNILLALIGMHIAAVLFYLFYKRQNLIASMWSGRRALPHETRAQDIDTPTGAALIGIVLAIAIVVILVRWIGR